MAFSKDFLWGAATASYQVEGAYNEDGRVMTIWDILSKGKIRNDDDGKVACDHYHKYKEDVALFKKLGFKAYRFSLSWARILSDEKTINPKGIEFYNNLINELIANGIEPLVTLYHWDLPMWAYNRGGWKNPEIVDWFATYTKVAVEAFSDRVKYWITFNEPQCFVGIGYVQGTQAPFEKIGDDELENVTTNVMLAHGKAVKTIRAYAKQPVKVGFAPTCSCIVPKTNNKEDVEFARQATFTPDGYDAFNAGWWSDAIVLGKVQKGMEFLNKVDINDICQPLDFYAYNIYNSANQGSEKYDWHKKPGMKKNALEWEIIPEVIYWSAKFLYERYNLPIIVTENGIANVDFVMSDGKVHDPQRIDFIKTYLTQLKKANDEGVPIIGYLHWSAMDNLEWSIGYLARFGLIYVDFTTLERTPKDSAYYYKQVIESNGENLDFNYGLK